MAKSTVKKVYATNSSHARWWTWLGLALIILLADQFTKILVVGYYQLGDSTPVSSFFNLVRAHNTGAAFSFLANAGGWQRWFFTAIGVVAAPSLAQAVTLLDVFFESKVMELVDIISCEIYASNSFKFRFN